MKKALIVALMLLLVGLAAASPFKRETTAEL